jgi:hypothetical protein
LSLLFFSLGNRGAFEIRTGAAFEAHLQTGVVVVFPLTDLNQWAEEGRAYW